MTAINRVDQAILLLKDRLGRLQQRAAGQTAATRGKTTGGKADPLASLQQLVRRGGITQGELRRALVRALLADAMGEQLIVSLEFQSTADHVLGLLEDSEAGRALLADALTELEGSPATERSHPDLFFAAPQRKSLESRD